MSYSARCSGGDHQPSRGLIASRSLTVPTIPQSSRLLALPTELLLNIYAQLENDPITQVCFAMSSRRTLEISSMSPIYTCCIAPGTPNRANLLLAIHPLTTSLFLTVHRTLSPAWHICLKCGKLKPTSAEYWAVKKIRCAELLHIRDWEWDRAVRNFDMKTVMACPACDLAWWSGWFSSTSAWYLTI
ncbi:hypothetical protein BJX64DRAFT_272607 [Aspergillus heterothallicus]